MACGPARPRAAAGAVLLAAAWLALGLPPGARRAAAGGPAVAGVELSLAGVPSTSDPFTCQISVSYNGMPQPVDLNIELRGAAGNVSESVTTDASGAASWSHRPAFPGRFEITAYYDANWDGELDPGEPSDLLPTWAYTPASNTRARLSGGLLTDGMGLAGEQPTRLHSTVNFRSSSRGMVSGKGSFSLLDAGMSYRIHDVDYLVGNRYAPAPQGISLTGGYVIGRARSGAGAEVDFRYDFTDNSSGADTQYLTLKEQDGTLWFGGGLRLDPPPSPRLKNDLRYGIGSLGITPNLVYMPLDLDFGTVPANRLFSKELTLGNRGSQPLEFTLDRGRVSETYFNFFPSLGTFTLDPGECWTTRVFFGATGNCTHRHPLLLTSPALAGTVKIPVAAVAVR